MRESHLYANDTKEGIGRAIHNEGKRLLALCLGYNELWLMFGYENCLSVFGASVAKSSHWSLIYNKFMSYME